MAVIIGSARNDENGKLQGGKAGDQTSKEVSTEKWYKHSKGWVVLRPKDPSKAEKIAQNMQFACDNNCIGYDQTDRMTLYDAAKKVGYNCSKVNTNCETDCSALVRVCCLYAGINAGNFNTGIEADTLMSTGQFEKLADAKYTASSDYLQRGDILVTKTTGHTVVVLTDGINAKGVKYMFEVEAVKEGSVGKHVLLCQKILYADGYKGKDGKALVLDGECGANTVYAINSFQTAMRKKGIECGTNGKNDGSCGQKCWKALLEL